MAVSMLAISSCLPLLLLEVVRIASAADEAIGPGTRDEEGTLFCVGIAGGAVDVLGREGWAVEDALLLDVVVLPVVADGRDNEGTSLTLFAFTTGDAAPMA